MNRLSCPPILLLCLVLPTVLVGTAASQPDMTPVALSDRLGEIIEPAERDYFGLFQRVSDFQSAAVFQVNDTTYAARVEYLENGAQTTKEIVLTQDAFAEIRRFIDGFEGYFRDTHTIEWGYVYQVAKPVDHIHPQAPTLVAMLANDSTIRGQFLYVDQDVLVLADDAKGGGWLGPEGLVLLRPSDLRRLRAVNPIYPQIIDNFDVILHGDATIFRRRVVSEHKDRAVFPTYLPPEVDAYIRTVLDSLSAPRVAMHADDGYSGRFVRRHAVALYHRFTHAMSSTAISYSSDGGDLGPRRLFFTTPDLIIAYQYGLTRRLGVGGRFTLYPRHALRDNLKLFDTPREIAHARRVDTSYVQLSGPVLHLIVTYDLIPALRAAFRGREASAPSFLSWKELRVEVGPTLAFLNTDTHLAAVDLKYAYTESLYQNHNLPLSQFTVGGYLGANSSWHLTSFISIGLSVDALVLPAIRIAYAELDDPLQAGITYESLPLVGKSDLNFDTSFSFHVGFHF